MVPVVVNAVFVKPFGLLLLLDETRCARRHGTVCGLYPCHLGFFCRVHGVFMLYETGIVYLIPLLRDLPVLRPLLFSSPLLLLFSVILSLILTSQCFSLPPRTLFRVACQCKLRGGESIPTASLHQSSSLLFLDGLFNGSSPLLLWGAWGWDAIICITANAACLTL